MLSPNRFVKAALIALLMSAPMPSAFAKKLLSDVALDWKPTKPMSANAADIGNLRDKKILVGQFTDNREKPNLIAENREDESEGTILPVTTATDIPAWVTTHLADQLQQIGLTTVGANGDFVLDGSVEKFFVTETDNYRGEVALHLRLKNKAGDIVWETTLTAKESRFGRSYKLDNYAEVFSDSIQNLARAIANSPDFQAALTPH